jgi:hypothetical protein
MMKADHDRNLGTRTPKEDDSRKSLQAERYSRIEQSMSSRASCVARIVHTKPMNDFMWPNTPTNAKPKDSVSDNHLQKNLRNTEKHC